MIILLSQPLPFKSLLDNYITSTPKDPPSAIAFSHQKTYYATRAQHTVQHDCEHALLPPTPYSPHELLTMAIIRNAAAPLRTVRCLRQPRLTSLPSRSFSITARQQGGHGNESPWDPPSGWLWGIRPGEKVESEGWEWPMYIFCGSIVVAGVALAFKPDTR